MAQDIHLWGWYKDAGQWVKCLVDESGKLIIDPTDIFESDPTENEHGKAPDSSWAFSMAQGEIPVNELRLTPKESSGGPEGTIYYDSDDDHVYVATE